MNLQGYLNINDIRKINMYSSIKSIIILKTSIYTYYNTNQTFLFNCPVDYIFYIKCCVSYITDQTTIFNLLFANLNISLSTLVHSQNVQNSYDARFKKRKSISTSLLKGFIILHSAFKKLPGLLEAF